MIACELLTGELPYDLNRLSTPRALLEITTAEPRRFAGMPVDLELIVHHALEKLPEERYQTGAAMAADLRDHLAGKRISLRRPSLLTRARRALVARPRLRRLLLGGGIAILAVVATVILVPGMLPKGTATWDGVYAQLEEADQLRHSGPQNRENFLGAAKLFQQVRTDIAILPPRPFTPDLNRYIKWRLGELYFFIGELEHDPDMLEQARGFWRDASAIPWTRGAATGIEEVAIVREKVLRIGRHHPVAGVGMANAALGGLRSPATYWRNASIANGSALGYCRDGSLNYQDASVPRPDQELDRAHALLNHGSARSALGAIVDSLAVVESGLAIVQAAAADSGIRGFDGRAHVHHALGAAFLRRVEVGRGTLPAEALAASLDSVWLHLDRAAELRDLNAGRRYWSLYRLRGHAGEVAATLAPDELRRRQLLQRAGEDFRSSLTPLRAGSDDFERALTQADLAVLEARLAALDHALPRFARADSLLGLAGQHFTSSRYPLQFAETTWQRGCILRWRWMVGADPADSAAAAAEFSRARATVPWGEFPDLHRRIDKEEQRLAAGRD